MVDDDDIDCSITLYRLTLICSTFVLSKSKFSSASIFFDCKQKNVEPGQNNSYELQKPEVIVKLIIFCVLIIKGTAFTLHDGGDKKI